MKAKRAEYHRQYYQQHKASIRAVQRQWEEQNHDRVRERIAKKRLDATYVAKRRAGQLAAEKRLNATSQPTAKRRCEEWSVAESALLLEMHAAGVQCIDIARRLGRTVFAVRTRAWRLWSEAMAMASGTQQGGAA